MFRPKNLNAAHEQKLRFKSSLDVAKAFENCHNVRSTRKGVQSVGNFEKVPFAHSVQKVLFNDNGKLYALCDGVPYVSGQGEPLIERTFSDGVMYKFHDALVFGAPEASYTVENGVATLAGLGMKDVTVGADRLVWVNGVNLYVSEPQNMLKSPWTLHMSASCGAVAAIGDKVYALGDECVVVQPKYVQTDSVARVFAKGIGNVKTAVALGTKIFFASDKGMYLLHNDVKSVFDELDFCADQAVACRLKNHVLISCKRSATSDENDITLLLDVDSEKLVGVFEFGFDSLYSDAKSVYGVKKGEIFCLDGEDGLSIFCEDVDFGTAQTKYLDKLVVRTSENVDVYVESDGVRTVYVFNGSPNVEVRRLNGYGKRFRVEVQAFDGMGLEQLELYAHSIKEE